MSGFETHEQYYGRLAVAEDVDVRTGETMRSHVYGFENVDDSTVCIAEIPAIGAAFGFVASGAVTVWDHVNTADGFILRTQRWFALPLGGRLHLHPGTRVVVSQREGFRGVRAFGGPIEPRGRLRYIDGCSDSLLCGPPLLGDPCLNHLHFPPGIEQTFHDHPSVRSGVVARGSGWCETPEGRVPLRAGMVWIIQAGQVHRFITTSDKLDVVAYHPDSDWGPTDEEHPMVNRTWVDGRKVDNTTEAHLGADVYGRSALTGD